MLYGVCDFMYCTDRPALFLGHDLAQRAFRSGYASLMAYSARCHANLAVGRIAYKLRPKWRPVFFKNPNKLCDAF